HTRRAEVKAASVRRHRTSRLADLTARSSPPGPRRDATTLPELLEKRQGLARRQTPRVFLGQLFFLLVTQPPPGAGDPGPGGPVGVVRPHDPFGQLAGARRLPVGQERQGPEAQYPRVVRAEAVGAGERRQRHPELLRLAVPRSRERDLPSDQPGVG